MKIKILRLRKVKRSCVWDPEYEGTAKIGTYKRHFGVYAYRVQWYTDWQHVIPGWKLAQASKIIASKIIRKSIGKKGVSK